MKEQTGAAPVTPVLSGFSFLESPRWHAERIWVADVFGGKVYSATEHGTDLRVEAEIPGQPSGIGWLPDGRLLVVSMKDCQIIRREANGELVTHADLTGRVVAYPNDMVVDDDGRAYVTSYGFDLPAGEAIEPTVLLRVDPDGAVTKVAEDLWFPNGIVIDDNGVLMVCESFGNRVTSFDVDADGNLLNRRIFGAFGPLPSTRDIGAALPALAVTPDGCCVDAEGALWIADPVHGRAVRVLKGGRIVRAVAPGTPVFGCTLGGSDGRTLFLCVAPDPDENARSATREARLLATTVDIPRAGLHEAHAVTACP